jgi:hypothetical protein
LFVLVTLVAAWLGYSVNWIRERRAALETHNIGHDDIFSPRPAQIPLAPGGLWLLGERGIAFIIVQGDGKTKEQLARLFPEAHIEYWTPTEERIGDESTDQFEQRFEPASKQEGSTSLAPID